MLYQLSHPCTPQPSYFLGEGTVAEAGSGVELWLLITQATSLVYSLMEVRKELKG